MRNRAIEVGIATVFNSVALVEQANLRLPFLVHNILSAGIRCNGQLQLNLRTAVRKCQLAANGIDKLMYVGEFLGNNILRVLDYSRRIIIRLPF